MYGERNANDALRELLAAAGWNGQDLVRAVNAAGREIGAQLRYQRTSAAQWLAGVRPRPPAPELIAEVLSRRLGRPVTPAEAGAHGPGHTRRYCERRSSVDTVVTRGDTDRHDVYRARRRPPA